MTPRMFVRARHLAVAALGAAALTIAAGVPASAAVVPVGSVSVQNSELTVIGTSQNDTITLITLPTDINLLEVRINGTVDQIFDRTTFTGISVSMLNGNDTFIDNEGIFGTIVAVDGGSGNDLINGTHGIDILKGGAGNDTIHASSGDDVVEGDSGNDFLDGDIGHDIILGGTGNDTSEWNPGDGSDRIDLGAGADTGVFNGSNVSEATTLTANGTHALFTRSVASVALDFDNTEAISADLQGSIDSLVVGDLRKTDVRTVNVDLSGFDSTPDASPDTVVVQGTENADSVTVGVTGPQVDVTGLRTAVHVHGGDTFDQLAIQTLGGNDKARVDSRALALMAVNVDLGLGQK